MDSIKKFFPYSFTKKEDVKSLVIMIVLHIVVTIVINAITTVLHIVLGFLPLVGWLLSVVGGVIGLYLLVGIVFTLLNYFKVEPFNS